MIQAYIRVNHIIHGKVWNCRIQVFSKLVESEYPGFQFLHIGTDAPNLQWVWPQRHGNRKVQYLCSRKRTTVKEKKKQLHELFFFWELSFFLGTFFFFLVNGGAERLAAPGSSAKPGPRSWSASKPGA